MTYVYSLMISYIWQLFVYIEILKLINSRILISYIIVLFRNWFKDLTKKLLQL